MSFLQFSPFPVLKTEHLALRQLKREDVNEIFLLRSDEEVNKYLDRPRATSPEDAIAFINTINEGIHKNEWIYWAICLKNNPLLIGTICLWNFLKEEKRAEIGYELLPAFQGKNLMHEALTSIIQYGFETLQLTAIEAWTSQNNLRSISILQKQNFHRDSAAESRMSEEDKKYGMIIYSITR